MRLLRSILPLEIYCSRTGRQWLGWVLGSGELGNTIEYLRHKEELVRRILWCDWRLNWRLQPQSSIEIVLKRWGQTLVFTCVCPRFGPLSPGLIGDAKNLAPPFDDRGEAWIC